MINYGGIPLLFNNSPDLSLDAEKVETAADFDHYRGPGTAFFYLPTTWAGPGSGLLDNHWTHRSVRAWHDHISIHCFTFPQAEKALCCCGARLEWIQRISL
jgi:hypothetical protein